MANSMHTMLISSVDKCYELSITPPPPTKTNKKTHKKDKSCESEYCKTSCCETTLTTVYEQMLWAVGNNQMPQIPNQTRHILLVTKMQN